MLETYSEGQNVIINDKILTVISAKNGEVKIFIKDNTQSVLTQKIEQNISGAIKFRRHMLGENH